MLLTCSSPELGAAVMRDAAGALSAALREAAQRRLDAARVEVALPWLTFRLTNVIVLSGG